MAHALANTLAHALAHNLANTLAHALAHNLRVTPARILPESIDSGNQTLLALRVVPGGRCRR